MTDLISTEGEAIEAIEARDAVPLRTHFPAAEHTQWTGHDCWHCAAAEHTQWTGHDCWHCAAADRRRLLAALRAAEARALPSVERLAVVLDDVFGGLYHDAYHDEAYSRAEAILKALATGDEP